MRLRHGIGKERRCDGDGVLPERLAIRKPEGVGLDWDWPGVRGANVERGRIVFVVSSRPQIPV